MRTNVILVLALTLIISSCQDDNNTKPPTIDFHELGYEDSKTATIGDELHMDAEIVAENKIDRIELELHPEGDVHKSISILLSGDEWEFDSVYTKFSGLKNTEFHEHIDIPDTAESGHYHFHFAVTDMEGYQTVFEVEVELLSPGSPK